VRLSHLGKWVGVSCLIGFMAGVAAVAFQRLITLLRGPFEALLGHRHEGLATDLASAWWALLLLPAGGLLVGLLTTLAPEARGHGTEAMIRCFHQLGGVVRRRVIALKALASAVTISSGGSAGSEGPVAQVGSGIGSITADLLGLSTRDRRLFLLAGSSAGIGALFCAPLGGALFAPEVLYRKPEFEGEAIIPCIISSIIAFTTFSTIEGQHRRVDVPLALEERLQLADPRELLLYLLLALLCALVSWAYVRTFAGTDRLFRQSRLLPTWLKPAVGGLGVALLALALARLPLAGPHGVLFGGYGLMEGSILQTIPLGLIALLIPAKVLATSLSIASGGSGGVFAPSLAIGALCGALVGGWGAQAFPGLRIEPACYALVGMGGFFAGVAKTPIAAVVIVCEMTGSYGLLAPLMLVAVLHFLLAQRWTIYETQVDGLVDSPAHAGEFVVDVLEDLRVADLLGRTRKPESVSETMTLRDVLDFVSSATGYYFPAVDPSGRLVGILSLSDVRRIFRETAVADLVIVRDFMVENVITTNPREDLAAVQRKLDEHGLHEIPVVSPEDPRCVVAMLTRQVLGAFYQERLARLRAPDPETISIT
jgi:CIC family chloride channel protein